MRETPPPLWFLGGAPPHPFQESRGGYPCLPLSRLRIGQLHCTENDQTGKMREDRIIRNLQPAQNLERLGPGLHRVHQGEDMVCVLLVVDPLAERMDRHCKFFCQQPPFLFTGARILVMIHATGTTGVVIVIMGVGRFSRLRSRGFLGRCRFLRGLVLSAHYTERLALDFKERAAAGRAALFEHFTPFEEVFSHDFVFFS